MDGEVSRRGLRFATRVDFSSGGDAILVEADPRPFMMRFESGNRRTVLDGLTRILDAGGLEELFSGPDDEALFLYHLLLDVSRGRASQVYWEICRTGRRRNVTPEYVIDRASVLLASIEERRRTDIYRILGVPALASEDAIRHRWLDVAKQEHPDVGGDPAAFRQAKEAYEILRDPERRVDYERFWLRAIGPIDRLVADDVPVAPPPSGINLRPAVDRRVVMVAKRTALPPTEGPASETVRMLQQAASRFAELHGRLDRHLAEAGLEGLSGVQALIARIEGLLGSIAHDDFARTRAEIEDGMARLEALRAELATLADLKQRLRS
jgi:hypothetical protein